MNRCETKNSTVLNSQAIKMLIQSGIVQIKFAIRRVQKEYA